MSKVDWLYEMANSLALETEGFFESKGPGEGNRSTNNYINSLGELAQIAFGEDCSEKKICGENSLAVDFYFQDEAAIVELALGVKRPNTEYEKDVLKAVMAKSLNYPVEKLVLIAKPGGVKKCNQPGRRAIKDWLMTTHGIKVEVRDLGCQA